MFDSMTGNVARCFVLVSVLSALLVQPSLADYALVWSDEFNGTSLNTDDWNYDIGNGQWGWGNNELQYYRQNNVAVADGNLIITSQQEYYGGFSFTSGKIHTRNKHSFLYGRMEIRAKIPTGQGMWPAFWMMPQDDAYGGWASSGEIDVMEAVNNTDLIHGTIHFGGEWPENNYSGGTYNPGGVNFGDDFHVYTVQWEPEVIRWYVDGILYSTKYSSEWYSSGAAGNPLAPFDQEFYLILNSAVGGNMPGCTNPSCITADLPQEFVVDYVRVYQETTGVSPQVTITSPNEGDNPPVGDVTIHATATDEDGTVERVEFFNGSTYLGTDTSEPFSYTWPNAEIGCFTIVAKAYDNEGFFGQDSMDLTVGMGCGQAPYHDTPLVLPTRVEAEDYDFGGPGIAYYDTDSGNSGSAYRLEEGVDIENCSDIGGGFNLGWLHADEWTEYSLFVPVAGPYTVEARVACLSDSGEFRLEFNGTEIGPIAVPVTGGWQSWTTVTATVNLEVGHCLMRYVTTDEGFNLNYIDLLGPDVSAVPEVQSPGFGLHPCFPNPFNPQTTIAFDVPREMSVSLQVFDVSGRLVDVLLDGQSAVRGRNEVVWQGRDMEDRAVPTGVYFYRLDAGSFTETQRMLLVK